MIDWNKIPKQVLVDLILHKQLPVQLPGSGRPTRQHKQTLVDALDLFCAQLRTGGNETRAYELEQSALQSALDFKLKKWSKK